MTSLGSYRAIDIICALFRWVGFALILTSIALALYSATAPYSGSLALLPLALGAAGSSLSLLLSADLLRLIADSAVSLRGIHEELAKIAGRVDDPHR